MGLGRPGRRGVFALILIALVAAPAFGATVMTGPDAINESADSGHNPYIETDVTKAVHEADWSIQRYENDQGELDSLAADVNDSRTNPYDITFSDIEADAFGDFPRNNDTVDTVLNARWWTEDESSTAGSGTITNVTTAPNTDALEVATSGQTATDTYQATFDSVDITSDAEKRYLQAVFDVDTLDTDAEVNLFVNDSDGDYVNATIHDSNDASTGATMANSTGEGYVFQRQIGAMQVSGTGDGTINEIQEIAVHISEADADVDFAAINVEKLGEWDFGEMRMDEDGDGDNETVTVREVNESGPTSLMSLDSMGPAFSSATYHDVTVEMQFWSSDQPTESDYERWNVSYSNASSFPSYDKMLEDNRRLSVPSAYDLSYANTELKDHVAVPSSRYQTVEYATTVGETNFSDISWTSATSSYDSLGDNVTLASGFGTDEVALEYEYPVTSAEYDNLMSTGGGAAPMEESDGGGLGSLPIIGGLIGGLLALFGLGGNKDGGS